MVYTSNGPQHDIGNYLGPCSTEAKVIPGVAESMIGPEDFEASAARLFLLFACPVRV